MERLPADTQATLLLVGHLGGSGAKPLTAAEYNRLAKDLHEKGQRPADLIRGPRSEYIIGAERLTDLLSRGAALALTMERWAQAGIRVVGRSEPTYPSRLKSKLRSAANPLIFYAGDLSLLDREAVCVVGSRDATPEGLAFAGRLGAACADQGFVVVSGDARGVDREAMAASLGAGGQAVGVLAEGLARAVLVKRNREPILGDRLLLLSPYDPDARFTVSHAMERNRYLYALAQAAVVVDSDTSGGTWSGALENLKHKWTPALVRIGGNTRAGNPKLADLGIMPLDTGAPALTIRDLIAKATLHQHALSHELPFASSPTLPRKPQNSEDADELFQMFVVRLRRFLQQRPRSEAEIAAHFELEALQVERWLEAAQRTHGLVRSGDNLVHMGSNRAA